jgi:hypothetical protein
MALYRSVTAGVARPGALACGSRTLRSEPPCAHTFAVTVGAILGRKFSLWKVWEAQSRG